MLLHSKDSKLSTQDKSDHATAKNIINYKSRRLQHIFKHTDMEPLNADAFNAKQHDGNAYVVQSHELGCY